MIHRRKVSITGDAIEFMVNELDYQVKYHEEMVGKDTMYFVKRTFKDNDFWHLKIHNLFMLRKELESNGYDGDVLERPYESTNGNEFLI